MSDFLQSVDISGVHVPLFSNISNLGIGGVFEDLSRRIDGLDPQMREWSKIPLLMGSTPYVDFLAWGTGSSSREVLTALSDLADDSRFREAVRGNLERLDDLPYPGDLRFHAITLYVLVRLTRPRLVVETGVAHGKSSTFLLGALAANGSGSLVSIDLPPTDSLADGSLTTMSDQETGWMVPDYLLNRWTLLLGDSIELLGRLTESNHEEIDFFVHDSLHTKDHAARELALVSRQLSPRALVAMDNIDMGCGQAFSDFLRLKSCVGFGFRDFAYTVVHD